MNPLKHIEYNETIGLFGPIKFWELNWADIESSYNGCGAGWNEGIVPDRIWGTDIRVCCQIHDHMYAWGDSDWDRLVADMIFLINLIFRIQNESKMKFLNPLRYYRAVTYFVFVRTFGGVAFKKEETTT